MGTATLAREVRRSLRARVPRRTLRRRLQIFTVNLLKQNCSGIVLPALSVIAAIMIITIGGIWNDGGPSILMLNALGSAAGVFLIANVKWALDREDFPRLDTLARLPWTDRQWLIEFLKGWRARLFIAPCFAGITLLVAKLVLLPDRPNGWLLVTLAFLAQVAIIAALALCLANAASLMARYGYLARLYRFVLIALLVATLAMASTQFASAVTAFAYPQALAVLPTAWPAGILYRVDHGLSAAVAFALLGLCITAAVLTGALALWRLKRSFKIAEIVQDPWGRGFVIRQSVWEYYSAWRDYEAAVQDGQEFVNEDGETTAAAAEGESQRWRGKRLGRPLDDFWKRQGWIADWFTPSERDVLAFISLAAGSWETPAEYFRRGVWAMLLVAAVVVIGPLVFDAAARDRGETLLVYGLGLMAYFLVSQGADASRPFRALPLSTTQWLWPRLKFQWLRLASVMPPGLLLLSALLWNMGKPVEEILQWICFVVTFAFLLLPPALVIGYSDGCRERWYSWASMLFLVKALVALVLLATGIVLLVRLPWPGSSSALALMAAATWLFWGALCAWYERGPVDAPVNP